MKTRCFFRGRVILLGLFIASCVPLSGCGGDSSSTAEYSLPDDVKAEIKARKDKAKAESKIKSKKSKSR
jgi:hypothetical protein